MNFFKLHSLPIFLIITSLLLALLGENTTQHFIYDRNSINSGELWRIITGHFIHLGFEHLVLNLLALVVIWFIVKEFIATSFWWITALILTIGISICLYLFMSELEWYVGLSGILHGLLVAGAVVGVSKKRKEFILLLLFVLVKIIYEQFYGSPNMDVISANVIINAHLYGALIGLFCAVVFIKKERQTKPKVDL